MLSYIVRRLLLFFPTLIGMTAVVFFIIALSPGGIGASLLSREMQLRPGERKVLEEYYNRRYGLDKPKVVQYLRWLNQISPVGFKTYQPDDPAVVAAAQAPGKSKIRAGDVRLNRPTIKWPNFGESFYRQRPVVSLIAEALPITLMLNLVSLPLIYFIAISLGILAAQHRGQLLDVGSGTVLIALWSLPTIWVGVLMIGFLANEQYLHWFPANGLHDVMADAWTFLPTWNSGVFQRGWLLDTLWHLVLPVICMSYGSFAFLSKLTRSSMLENIAADFSRTARAKGLGPRVVLLRHVFRNSLIPLITVSATVLPSLVVGAVIVETIFGIPGMGKLAIDAIASRDRELFLSDTLLVSFLTLVGYLLGDILYAIADPRVTYDA